MASPLASGPIDVRHELPTEPTREPLDVPPSSSVRHIGLQGWLLVSVAVSIIVAALQFAHGFFVPLVTSIIIALALAPLVRRLARWMSRGVAAAIVVASLLGGTAVLAYALADEAAAAVAELPTAARQLRQAVRAATTRSQSPVLDQLRRAVRELERTATENTAAPATPAGVTPVQIVQPAVDFGVMGLGSGAVLAVSEAVMMTFLVYFLLASGELFKRKLVILSGERLSKRKVTVEVIDHIGERVARSLSHLVLTGAIVGIATWLAFWFMGVNYAPLWGLAAAVMNAVPYFGPTIVGMAAVVAALLQFAEIGTALSVGAVSLVITTVEGMLLTPLLFGQLVRVNPVAVFVSALFWGWLWGPWGLLLALPLLVILKTIAESVEDLKPLAELLSD